MAMAMAMATGMRSTVPPENMQLKHPATIRCSILQMRAFQISRNLLQQQDHHKSRRLFARKASSSDQNQEDDKLSSSSSSKTPKSPTAATIREKALGFIEKQAGYFWLLGPIVTTAAVVVPALTVCLVGLLQRSFWIGLGGIFGLDLLFVLAADAFFVLTDKAGHHQNIPGGVSPWIGPWEYTGYPKGIPQLWDYISYVGVGLASTALIFSIFVGKFQVALAAYSPYMALVFVQAAYERLLCTDRLPTYPLVPLLYTFYRLRQLARAKDLFTAYAAGSTLEWSVKSLMVLWVFNLTTYLSHLPWLYSTWNSNRAT